jgi:hypothetical protein
MLPKLIIQSQQRLFDNLIRVLDTIKSSSVALSHSPSKVTTKCTMVLLSNMIMIDFEEAVSQR